MPHSVAIGRVVDADCARKHGVCRRQHSAEEQGQTDVESEHEACNTTAISVSGSSHGAASSSSMRRKSKPIGAQRVQAKQCTSRGSGPAFTCTIALRSSPS